MTVHTCWDNEALTILWVYEQFYLLVSLQIAEKSCAMAKGAYGINQYHEFVMRGSVRIQITSSLRGVVLEFK